MEFEERKTVVQYTKSQILQAAKNSSSRKEFRKQYQWAFNAALNRGGVFFHQVMALIPEPANATVGKKFLKLPKKLSDQVKRRMVSKRSTMHKEVGKYFKTKRQEANLSLDDASSRFGCSHQYISNWERGAAPVPLARLKLICELYGIKNKEEVVKLFVSLYELQVRSALF
jgi:DNA-binding transcriptional regulator YiaG